VAWSFAALASMMDMKPFPAVEELAHAVTWRRPANHSTEVGKKLSPVLEVSAYAVMLLPGAVQVASQASGIQPQRSRASIERDLSSEPVSPGATEANRAVRHPE